jgi:ankyrin repeat protein
MRTPAFVLILWLAAGGAAVADDALADLIQAGNRDAALAMISDGADVNIAQGDGTTPLHWAVYKIDAELVAELLDRGAKPDVINNYGSSPLAEAVKIGELSLVEMLLEAGADLEAPNQDGQTALMLTARAGALDVAELLIERGANVNTRETWRGQTALMWAADGRSAGIVELLIAHGADVHARALANEWEAQISSEPRGQYRPTGGLTALLYAARSGCTTCVAPILDAGANIDQPNPDGVTPLMVALDNSRFDTAKVLLERGANPHTWDWWGRTPLYVAVDMNSYRARPGTEPVEPGNATGLDLIRRLLAAGVNPNPQLNMHRPSRGGNIGRFADDLLTTGATPLLRAASSHDREAVVALLEHGALVDLPNVMGVTPLMAAAGVGVRRLNIGGELELSGDVESRAIATIEVLLAAGADINARIVDNYGRTGRIARASQMTEREGQTALYGAVKFAWAGVVAYLVERGASVDIVDAHGRSPIDAALGTTGGRDNIVSPEIAEMLEKARNPAG